MLPESRLHTFLDEAREFAAYFLDGQRLIQDLALIHPIRGAGFEYFREVVLRVQPMIAFLKHGEQFGFYIDSEVPYFRLKIETGHHGMTRCMLLPAEFQEFPGAMQGIVRVQKVFPNNQSPSESVVEARGLRLRDIVNRVLADSYQVHCVSLLSEVSDQSLLLHQLPPMPGTEDYDFSLEAVRSRRAEIRDAIDTIFSRALNSPEDLDRAFGEIGFRHLASRPVEFRCMCSKPRMIENLRPLYRQESDLFDPGQDTLEVVCEYCKSRYEIGEAELQGPSPNWN